MPNFFQKLLTRAVRKAVNIPFVGTMVNRYGGNYQGFFKKKSFLSEYKNWVYACVNARAEDVSSIQLKLMKGDQEVENHELLDVINRVNLGMTKHDLFFATQAFKDLDGNAFWFLARDGKEGKGKIREIYMLRPDKVSIVPSKENPLLVAGYVYSSDDGSKVPFEASEILHHKTFSPTAPHPFPHKGMGVVEAAQNAVDTDNEIRAWNYSFFKNSARPDGILQGGGDSVYDDDQYKRLKEEWNAEHQGSENAHKVSILSGGLEWKEITRTQADMQFSDQMTTNRDEILALFRTPKSILGITDDVNRANADAAIYVFALRTVKPLMQHLVDTLNEFLVPEFDENLSFTFVSPVPEDRTATIAEYTAGIDKWLTRNEIRAREGLPPTKNGDDIMGPISLTPIDHTAPEKVKNAKPTMKKKKMAVTDVEKAVEAFVAKLPEAQKKGLKQLTPEAKTAYIELWNKHIDTNTAPLKRKVDGFFTKQEKEVQANLREEMKGLEAKEYKFKGIDDILFDEEDAIGAGINLITPFLREYVKESGKQGTLIAGGDNFDNSTASIEKFIATRAKYFATTINETTREDLLRSIQEGIDASETLDELSTRVSTIYDAAKDYRTDRIARTEVSASSNFGAIEAYQQAGVEQHQWVVVSPNDTDCAENDGAIVKIGDSFPDGDEAPPVHPNCVCTTVPVFNDGE